MLRVFAGGTAAICRGIPHDALYRYGVVSQETARENVAAHASRDSARALNFAKLLIGR